MIYDKDGLRIRPVMCSIDYPRISVCWSNGVITTARMADGEKWDTEKGILVCFAKMVTSDVNGDIKYLRKTRREIKKLYKDSVM